MKNIDALIEEVETNEKTLNDTKREIADAIFRIYTTYLYSIDQYIHTFFVKRRRIGMFVIKSRWRDGDEYSSGEPLIKIYYKRKLILKMNGEKYGKSTNWKNTKYKLYYIYKFDSSKIIELQELHNSLIIMTQDQLQIKNANLNNLNNFQLALKELET